MSSSSTRSTISSAGRSHHLKPDAEEDRLRLLFRVESLDLEVDSLPPDPMEVFGGHVRVGAERQEERYLAGRI